MNKLEYIANEIQKHISSKGVVDKYAAEINRGSYNYTPGVVREVLIVYDIKSRKKWGDYLCIIEPDRCKDSSDEESFSLKYIMAGESDGYTAQEAIDAAIHEINRDLR